MDRMEANVKGVSIVAEYAKKKEGGEYDEKVLGDWETFIDKKAEDYKHWHGPCELVRQIVYNFLGFMERRVENNPILSGFIGLYFARRCDCCYRHLVWRIRLAPSLDLASIILC